jgi:hemolysin activation/secretion protein
MEPEPKPPVVNLLLAMLVIALAPLAAQGAPAVPDTGSILQQIKPGIPPAPTPAEPGLNIEREGKGKLPPSVAFEVKHIQITGNTLFDTASLHALVADAEGKSLTLAELDKVAGRITDYYHSHGYPLARAIIPAQTIKDGVVVIQVIEARYGKIRLDNSSRVDDDLLQATLSPLQSGQVIGQAEMDHVLLLLSDVPGVAIDAILKPGEKVGTSDMIVETRPTPAVIGSVYLDNYGNRYIGRMRLGASVNFIDPAHHGDVLNLGALSSGSGMSYGRLAYESLLNGEGTRIGGSYSFLRYTLGDTLASLGAHGTADIWNLWANHPFMRSRNGNMYGNVQYDRKQLRDRIDSTLVQTDRHLDNWTASLNGDLRSSGAVSTWELSCTTGRLIFDNSAAQLADEAAARTAGRFTKWNINLTRLQALSQKNALYFAFTGQAASTNLDSSEKMTVGGPYTVRAYDMGAASGDAGYLVNIEFRRDMGRALLGQWQAVAFVDSAQIRVNRNTWTTGANSGSLNGAGVGFYWSGQKQWHARAYLATRLGSSPQLVGPTSSARAWAEVSKMF